MLKANEFETADDTKSSGTKQRFSDESNIHYRYSSADDLIKNTDDLGNMIKHHIEHQRPRLKVLQEYYKGNNTTILRQDRRKEDHLADNRATHNFAKYVSQFIQGYMVGVPLKTTYNDDDINEQIRDMNRDNDADEHNSDLVLDQSIYGRAYELLYRNKRDETRFTILNTLETFIVYDDTVEMNPIAGVRYIDNQFDNDETKVFVYIDSHMYTYSLDNAYKMSKEKAEPHYFGDVPIIEYENNKFRQGDFEDILSLIDLYDESQSDTANYMTDLNDAMLKIMGNLDIDSDEAKAMKKNNILMLQTEPDADGNYGQADADYIYKKYDVSGTEAYKDRIFNNILLFTSIPNLLGDQKGISYQSGEALKMKLFALEQKRAVKERLFKKSLRDRYRLISNISDIAAEGSFNVNELTITFTENLPRAIDKELEWFGQMGGNLSQKTLLSQLSFVDNPDEEMKQIETEDTLQKAKEEAFKNPVTEEVDTDGEE